MRNANAPHVDLDPVTVEHARHERRTPTFMEDPAEARRNGTALHWPASWPAALYAGEAAADCTVHAFCDTGALLTMVSPPQAGTWVLLKFPFTIFLKAQVAWMRGGDLGLKFDEESSRSARIVEDVLLDSLAAC